MTALSRRDKTGSAAVADVMIELLHVAGITPNGPNPWDPQIHDDRVWQRVLGDRGLGLGEAYQDGWFDVDRLDEFLTRILIADLSAQIRPSLRLLGIAASQVVLNRQSVSRAGRNASAHYDIGNDLYEQMLDKRMIYTCAYWADSSNLDDAQEAKLDMIAQKLHLEPGLRVLDIGCGWGGLSKFLAENYDVEVTGITPAAEQVRAARELCAGLSVNIEQLDYRELVGEFDRIVSVGMMEHVGTKNLGTFFDACDRLLTDDGVMMHHTIGSNDRTDRADPWLDKHIFPGGVLPSLGQIADASGTRFVIEDVHNFGPDYDRTLMAWSDNIAGAWDGLTGYDERFRRTWHYYLMSSAAAFRSRSTQLWQIAFRRAKRRSGVYQTVR